MCAGDCPSTSSERVHNVCSEGKDTDYFHNFQIIREEIMINNLNVVFLRPQVGISRPMLGFSDRTCIFPTTMLGISDHKFGMSDQRLWIIRLLVGIIRLIRILSICIISTYATHK